MKNILAMGESKMKEEDVKRLIKQLTRDWKSVCGYADKEGIAISSNTLGELFMLLDKGLAISYIPEHKDIVIATADWLSLVAKERKEKNVIKA